MLERLENEPIMVPTLLTAVAMFVNDLLTQIDGQTAKAAVPIVVGLIARHFVTGPKTAAREVVDAYYGGGA
jgi:hypothetical protein